MRLCDLLTTTTVTEAATAKPSSLRLSLTERVLAGVLSLSPPLLGVYGREVSRDVLAVPASASLVGYERLVRFPSSLFSSSSLFSFPSSFASSPSASSSRSAEQVSGWVREAVFASTISLAPSAPFVSYSLSSSTLALAEPVRYTAHSQEYVHVPSWVTVSRAPFTAFGRSLFGLAVPSTASVYVRDDLQGSEFTEVLFHEVLHTLYPSCSEREVRSMVLARFGANASLHSSVCRP